MPSYFAILKPSDVTSAETFASYCNQKLGTPYPNASRELPRLKRGLKQFFATNPRADWFVLVRTVDWCKAKRRRVAYPWSIIEQTRWAWAAGAIPELDPVQQRDTHLEHLISEALTTETSEYWRRALGGALTLGDQRLVYDAWKVRS